MRLDARSLHCAYTCLLVTACNVYDDELSDAPRRANAVTAQTAANCAKQAELCNDEDDDCDGVIDEQAAAMCAIDNADARCVAGQCQIDNCWPGFVDCNEDAADGCERPEAELACDECGHACTSEPHEPTEQSTRSAATPTTVATTMAKPMGAAPSAGAGSDTDAGAAPSGAADCIAHAETCNGLDDDCDGHTDEAANCACANLLGPGSWPVSAYTPTGQGPACDRCACEQCAADITQCLMPGDRSWTEHCSALLQCYGRNLAADNCSGGDCYQAGQGPCANELRAALLGTGISCSTERITTPCAAATAVREHCLQTTCAAVCKF